VSTEPDRAAQKLGDVAANGPLRNDALAGDASGVTTVADTTIGDKASRAPLKYLGFPQDLLVDEDGGTRSASRIRRSQANRRQAAAAAQSEPRP